ncbi:hypothetical protein CROQUDRAFT_299842 [Cronartium quercuum f. sp. fusiforme G11]|uniref:Uncharacterized protein n=1 Tax=Cronartium quercuum f. sp. fusiforme G11 TaxID=708437 RepID=A0A9P6NP05_9BASI|nr:hypothetical protein CROQUDRAFT_299842 [Cronartium quercuum f. sp. fusiforme G11]
MGWMGERLTPQFSNIYVTSIDLFPSTQIIKRKSNQEIISANTLDKFISFEKKKKKNGLFGLSLIFKYLCFLYEKQVDLKSHKACLQPLPTS